MDETNDDGNSIAIAPDEEPQMMCRGERPQVHLNFKQIDKSNVYDEFGNEIRVGDIWGNNSKIILIFIRNFLCFMCKEYVDDLSLIPRKSLEDVNVKLVVIGCAPYKFIKSFREATGYKGILYCDPERKLYRQFGCLERMTGIGTRNTKESKHVKSGFIMGVFKSVWRGVKYQELQGDVHQQGGAFIIAPGHQVLHQHIDLISTDHAPINDLLRIATVEEINFARDRPVLSI